MYTVYRITNLVNSKTYIGVHKTNKPMDSYYGSGTAIKNAISKYGKENFRKEILLISETRTEAYDLERKLTENFNEHSNYNMRLGGVGGFTKESALKGALARIEKTTVEERSLLAKKAYLEYVSRMTEEEYSSYTNAMRERAKKAG